MSDFDQFTSEEKEVLNGLTEGRRVDEFDLRVIDSLVDYGALENFSGSLIVPVLVWNRWAQFKEETGWHPSH